ncbi:NfeD family protein [Shouchella lonarensis]|uniref:Membrane protein NfeD2 N-terminal transmembrane domain-containing protein n=1 Tax=Shouchella lonarensis TaxID=1464122 RepID=A0A1G6GV26_9BACI|nr:NfeD family protein [Shouchella lonarensis]SDB85723.1 hypothetical protein SAMN05421737_10242 [Shouchella lonarensis]
MALETMYLILLLVSGGLTILYVLLSDILEGIFSVLDSWLSPTVILSFTSFFAACAYLLERFSPLTSLPIAGISLLVALVLSSCLHIFVLTPLNNAEESNTYHEKDLEGRSGEIITAIPHDGFGEVLLKSDSGMIAKTATAVEGVSLPAGTQVVIVKMSQGVAYVSTLDLDILSN